jgi:hypothetical protein
MHGGRRALRMDRLLSVCTAAQPDTCMFTLLHFAGVMGVLDKQQ